MNNNIINTKIILRNDSSTEWLLNGSVVLLRGEVGIEFFENGSVKLKIGDGTKTWDQLPYFGGTETSVYEVDAINGESHNAAISRVVDNAQLSKGNVAIVKELIVEGKYSYSAYVYNGTTWAAMDGNYSAKNIYFDENLMFTHQFGRHKPGSSGSYVLPVADNKLSLFDLLVDSYSQEQYPSKTDPSVSVTLTGAGTYEVGTEITPTFTASFEDGKYTYGPEPTGATVTAWKVTSTDGETFTSNSGTCNKITVADDTDFSVTAVATHTQGAVALTNKNNEYPSVQIASGSKTSTSSKITGYRSFFYGILNTSSTEEPLTSDIVRTRLTNGGNYNSSKSLTLNATATSKRMVILIPSASTRGGLNEVILTSAMNTPITSSYTKTEAGIKVEGVNGATAVDYDMYVYEPASIDAGEVHQITLK